MMLTPGGVRYERKTVSGRHLEFSTSRSPAAPARVIGISPRSRTRAGGRAGARHHAVRAGQHERWRHAVRFRLSLEIHQQRLIDFLKLPPEAVEPGLSLMDILRYQGRRGVSARSRRPSTSPAHDLTSSPSRAAAISSGAPRTSISISASFPLPNGDTIAVTRDITELKTAAGARPSKEAAETARDEVERTHQIMQTVFDNLGDGVSLFDKDFRWVFSNRHHREQHGYTPDKIQPGDSALKLIRHTITRGEYGPLDDLDIDAQVAEVAARMRKPGGNRYERRAYGGRYIEYIFRELEDGGLLGVYHDITELRERRPRCRRERSGGGRPRRGGIGDAGQVHLPRHHEPRNPTPMNGVLGMMEILEHQGLDKSSSKAWRRCAIPRRRCCASSTTCSTSPRSRPAAWSSKKPRSRCPA
jgi:PAS domain-containing protein